MAKPQKYPRKHTIRIDVPTEIALVKKAKHMQLKPSECLRVLIEDSLNIKPKKEAKNVA